MNLFKIITTVALVASTTFAASAANFESSPVLQMEPVIVEATRLPTAQEIASADLAASREAFNASSIAIDELDLSQELVRQATADLNASEARGYQIVPASFKSQRRARTDSGSI